MHERWLKTAGEAVGLIAAVIAGVYLLGGLVYTLRLAFVGLPIDSIVGVIGQIPREGLIAVGFVEGLGPAAVVGLAAGLGYAASGGPKAASTAGVGGKLRAAARWLVRPIGLLILSLILVAPAVWLSLATEDVSGEHATAIFGWLVTLAGVCLCWRLLHVVGQSGAGWDRASRALVAGLLWAAMAIVPSVMLGAAISLDEVAVCTTTETQPLSGQLISDSKDRVLVATGAADSRSVVSVPGSRVTRVEYGDELRAGECPPAKAE